MRITKTLQAAVLAMAAQGLYSTQAQFDTKTDNGRITITKYTGSGGAVAIPSTLNGLPVTRLREWAFYGCTSLTSVVIPESVTIIGWNAFAGCTALTSLVIPNSVTSIEEWAFYSCTSLTRVTCPRQRHHPRILDVRLLHEPDRASVRG